MGIFDNKKRLVIVGVVLVVVLAGIGVGIYFGIKNSSNSSDSCNETPILSNLTLTDHLDSIEVTWESETFQRCSEEYIVNLYVNFELESTVTTGEFKHVFNHETEPCNLIMIELIAVVNGISGSTISKNYEPDIDIVQNLNFDTTTLLLTWSPSRDSDMCKYQLREGSNILANDYEETSYSFQDYVFESCKTYVFGVIVVSPYGKRSNQVTETHESGLGMVRDVIVQNTREEVTVKWTSPVNSGACGNVAHTVEYWDGEDLKDKKVDITENQATFNLQNNPCSTITVKVFSRVLDDDIVGQELILNHLVKPGAVEDLEAVEDNHKVHVTWSLPFGYDTCPGLQYRARYLIYSNIIDTADTQDLEVTFDLITPSCNTINITVILLYNGEEHNSASTEVVAKIREVENLRIERDVNELLITWEPPNPSQTQCGYIRYALSYYLDDIVVDTYEQTATTTRYEVYQCSTFRVAVLSIGNGDPGYSTEATYETLIDAVTNLNIDQIIDEAFELLTVSWRAPINLDPCGAVDYQVRYLEGETEHDRVTVEETYSRFILQSVPCAKVIIEVTAKSEEVTSMATTQEYIVKMPIVQNIIISERDSETLVINWNPPLSTGFCTNIKYFVYYHVLETDIKDVYEVDETSCEISLPLEDCLAIEIFIEAESDGSIGRSDSTMYHTETCHENEI